jgi:hypothetical protein
MMSVDMDDSEASFSDFDLHFLKIAGALAGDALDNVTKGRVAGLRPAELLARWKQTNVLVLGKDTGNELEILREVQKCVSTRGFIGHMVKDAPDIPEMTNEEKVRALADASRFVIVENSYPAGQIAELKMLSTNRVTTAILREQGKGSTWMVADYDLDYRFMREFVYEPRHLSDIVDAACDWAHQSVSERTRQLDKRYPWRTK